MKILVADDTALMRTMLSSWLGDFGYEVILAVDGQEAVEKAWDEGIDIGLIDWEMPKLTGLEVCWKLRADPRSRQMHLIVMTANQDSERLIEALDGGADDFLRKPIQAAELLARIRAASRIVSMRAEVMKLMITDILSGVLNRRGFFDAAARVLDARKRSAKTVSLIMADIDFFKRVNDDYGHAAGDAAITAFGQVCTQALKGNGVAGRIGGEEFALLLPNAELKQATEVAEVIRRTVADTAVTSEDTQFHVTVSLGVTPVGAEEITVDDALNRADTALYQAKRSGRNRVVATECNLAVTA